MKTSQQAEKIIRQLAHQTLEKNPFLKKIKHGLTSRQEFIQYQSNLSYTFEHAVPFIQRGVESALRAGQQELAKYYQKKIAEETGHEKWAQSDLKKIGISEPLAPTPACRSVVERILSRSKEDPFFFLAYATYAEAGTVAVGPQVIHEVHRHLGIPPEHFSSIAKHVEFDIHHAAEELNVLDQVLTSPAQVQHFLSLIEECAALVSENISSCVDQNSLAA